MKYDVGSGHSSRGREKEVGKKGKNGGGRNEGKESPFFPFYCTYLGIFSGSSQPLLTPQELSSLDISFEHLGTLCYSTVRPFSGCLNLFINLYKFISVREHSGIVQISHFTVFKAIKLVNEQFSLSFRILP